VILCTTTLIYPSDIYPNAISEDQETLKRMLNTHRVVCVGQPAENGKIKEPEIPMEKLAELADYVLVEADGAKRKPLKAHLPFEPGIPSIANQTICVVGASGLEKPIDEAAHRPERFAELAEANLEDGATPERVAMVLTKEGLADRVFINQVETKRAKENAKRLAQKLEWPVVAGSLYNKTFYVIKAQ
ncbi:MAG: selenium cofactor biosynthesis protein YqeC, partial [Eubacteriales bacterium]